MGQCGCGDFNGMWRLPAPGGKWYVIGPYGGCKDCAAPVGLMIDLMDASDLRHWEAGKLPLLGGDPNFGIPIFDSTAFEHRLAEALVETCRVMEDQERDGISFETIAEETRVYDLIRAIVYETATKFRDDVVKRQRLTPAPTMDDAKILRVHGPVKCDRQCSCCDGDHHWLEMCVCEDDDLDKLAEHGLQLGDPTLRCKHCGVWADYPNWWGNDEDAEWEQVSV